jgi:hypothetical protein
VAGFGTSGGPPQGISAFSKQVFDLLLKHTPFAWPIMTAQCRRANVDPLRLDPESLGKVAGFVAEGVGAFTSPAKARQVADELALLSYRP